MEIMSAISATSLDDGEQNERLDLIEKKIELLATFLKVKFVEKLKEEEYKNWLGKKKTKTISYLTIVN